MSPALCALVACLRQACLAGVAVGTAAQMPALLKPIPLCTLHECSQSGRAGICAGRWPVCCCWAMAKVPQARRLQLAQGIAEGVALLRAQRGENVSMCWLRPAGCRSCDNTSLKNCHYPACLHMLMLQHFSRMEPQQLVTQSGSHDVARSLQSSNSI